MNSHSFSKVSFVTITHQEARFKLDPRRDTQIGRLLKPRGHHVIMWLLDGPAWQNLAFFGRFFGSGKLALTPRPTSPKA